MNHTNFNPEDIARVTHDVNRAYCQAWGDNSQPLWVDAPEWQKESAIKGVNMHLDAIFNGQPGVNPEKSHEAWCDEKRKAGWVYGAIKDPEHKQHPCLVKYEDLSVEQRAKDYIFRAVVVALAHKVDVVPAGF